MGFRNMQEKLEKCCCPSPIHLEQYNYMINHEYYTLASLENTKVYQQHLGMCGILCAFYLWLQKSQKKEWRIMVKLELWVDTLQCVRLAWWLFKLFQYKKMICMDESLKRCLLKHSITVSLIKYLSFG